MATTLQGDPYNLQGSTPSLQGGYNPQSFVGPVLQAPQPVPQPNAVATVPKTVTQPAPTVYFYKPDRNSQQVFDANGTPLSYDQYIAAGGRPDFSNVLDQAIPTRQVQTYQQPNQTQPTYTPPVITNPNQQLAQSAGGANLGFDEYQKIIEGQSAITQAQKDEINKNLGIPDLESSVFALPTKSTEQLYNDAYGAAGLGDLKTKIQAKLEEVNNLNKEFTDASGVINENPFLSEASRIGRIKRAQDQYEMKKENLDNEVSQLTDLYNSGVGEVHNLVTRQSQDFTTNQQLNASKLQYLLKKAEDQYTTAQAANTSKAYSYLPDYLNAKANAQKPDTIGSAESGYWRWNPSTGTFEQVISPQDKSNEILSPTDALALGVPYGTTRAQAMALGIIPAKPATDVQNQAAGYALRLKQSGDILNNLESAIQGYNVVGFEAQMRLPSYAQSSQIQSYNQAAQNFINAVLRRESGAAISQAEFDNAYQQYLPRPGDSAQVLEQKQANRDAVYQSLVNSAGSAYKSLTGGSTSGASDPLGLYGEMGGGLVTSITQKYPDGSTGGQCGTFAHQLVNFPPVGDSKSEKIAAVQKYGIPADQWRQNVQVGDVIITGENPTYGHVAVVNAILPGGKIQLSESNFKQSGTVSNDRVISIDSSLIYGAIRGTLKI